MHESCQITNVRFFSFINLVNIRIIEEIIRKKILIFHYLYKKTMKKNTLLCLVAIAGTAAAAYLITRRQNRFIKLPVVDNFDINRFVGKWYEIARLDFIHEKNLSHTTAFYSFNEDDTIKVVNKGFDFVKNTWVQSVGKADFVKHEFIGKLKVSFFGPFYSAYNIISLDDDYHYALIFGKNTDYLWFLSREKNIPKAIKNKYLKIARAFGYQTNHLVWVNHN